MEQISGRVKSKLDGDGGQEQTHDADGDVHGNRTEPARAARRKMQNNVAGERDHEDAKVQGDCLSRVGGLLVQKNGGRNCTGAGEHRDRKWRHSDVCLLNACGGFFACFVNSRALGAQHVERDEQKDDAGGELKSRHGDAKEFEDPFAGSRKNNQDAGHDATGEPSHSDALFSRVGGSHREKRRNRGKRIDDHKQGARSQQGVLGEAHAEQGAKIASVIP